MTALAANRKSPYLLGDWAETQKRDIVNDGVMYSGGIVAVDYLAEAHPGADTLGLRVIGVNETAKIDNADDGEEILPEKRIYRLGNSTTYPLTIANIAQVCYVEDDQTVAGDSTNRVAAGIVFDVDSTGVWVDMRSSALALACSQAKKVIVAVTATTSTLTAAQCFAGNVIVTASNSGATTLTLPTAIAGYKIGIQRLTAEAGYDVTIQAPAGDTVLGSAAAGTAANTTDAISDILYIATNGPVDWVADVPYAKDVASWLIAS